ncbi:MAG: hypothetical protein MUE40_02020 [Anaerolineae bacterium]|jgi:hypothetical protein|nr:hypothetical protein [Anaerolineae bacterium]
MTIQVEWDNPEKTIIRCTFPPTWSLEDFMAAFPVADRMLHESQTQVTGIIVDDSQELMPPRGALTAFRQTMRRGRLPVVFVGANSASRTMMDMLQSAYQGKRRFFYVATLAEARQVLARLAELTTGEYTGLEQPEPPQRPGGPG